MNQLRRLWMDVAFVPWRAKELQLAIMHRRLLWTLKGLRLIYVFTRAAFRIQRHRVHCDFYGKSRNIHSNFDRINCIIYLTSTNNGRVERLANFRANLIA